MRRAKTRLSAMNAAGACGNLFEFAPCAGHDPVARVQARLFAAEDESSERKHRDVAAGGCCRAGRSASWRAAIPNENPVFWSRMPGEKSCGLRGFAVPGHRKRKNAILFVDVFRSLPYLGGLLNRMVTQASAASPFVRDVKKNHEAWERRTSLLWN